MTIIAAADGSALGNPGPAGWAWYVDEDCWAAGGWPESTNNRGELTAVLELLRATAGTGEKRGWRKADGKPVLNDDLMKALDAELAGRTVRFEWVRGHVGHPLNEAADSRARAAATAYQQGAAVPAGPGWPGAGGDAGGARGSVTAGAEGSESSAASSDAEVVPGATAARRARLRQDEGMLF